MTTALGLASSRKEPTMPVASAGAALVPRVIQARPGVSLALQPAWSDAALVLSLFALGCLVSVAPALLAYRAPPAVALRS